MKQVTYGHLLCHLEACGTESLKHALELDHWKVLGQSEEHECTKKQHVRG